MQRKRILLSSALARACIALAACNDPSSSDLNHGTGGAAGTDGLASAGSTTITGSTAGSGGGVGTAGGGTAGMGIAGMGIAGTGTAGRGTAGRGTAGRGTAGIGTAGMGTGGTETGAGGSGAPPAATNEDDGADCAVTGLADSGSLPAIAKLPDPFKKLDGTRMSTKAEWRCRREEIKKQAEKYALGTKPAKPQSVMGTVSNTSISVNIMDNGKSSSFSATVALPKSGSAPYPSIIVYGGAGFGAPLDASVIASEGVALINFDPYALGKEGTPRNNKQGAFYTIAGSNSSTGLLVAWAWGVSRIIDVIEQSDGKLLKADGVGVTGCSRFGKGAFIAGVFDQRVALTMPIESGSAGVPIWRGIPGEGAQSLSSAYGEQPWFGDAFSAFTGSPAKAPLDTHELVAMVAPRGLFIMDNPHIANLGPKSAHVAALAGAEVYKALGAADNITYYSDVQNGSHCSQRPEWSAPLKSNIQRFLKKTGNTPGVIKASASATGKLSDWSDWTTPTLN
jgi:hypothetical protein